MINKEVWEYFSKNQALLVKEVLVIPRSIAINFLLSTVLFLKILRSNHSPSREKRICTRLWRGSYHTWLLIFLVWVHLEKATMCICSRLYWLLSYLRPYIFKYFTRAFQDLQVTKHTNRHWPSCRTKTDWQTTVSDESVAVISHKFAKAD